MQFLALSCARPVSHESYSFCLRVSAPGIITGKRPRRRWEDNITIHLEEIGINAGNWLDSAQDRKYWRAFVNAALNLRVP